MRALTTIVVGVAILAACADGHSRGSAIRERFSLPTTDRQRIVADVEYTVALLVSPECRACTDTSFKAQWRRVRDGLAAQAKAANAVPAFIGVGVTWSIEDGLVLLSGFEGLDEIAVGSSWLNVGFEEFADYGFPSRHAVPQIVVVRKRRTLDSTGTHLEEKALLHRSIGLTEIRTWAERGAPL
ncbi:MAG: hypothetical protein AB7I33_10385 [Gemmatimonadales bacterium]